MEGGEGSALLLKARLSGLENDDVNKEGGVAIFVISRRHPKEEWFQEVG